VSAPDRNIAALPGLKSRLDDAASPFHQGAERVSIRRGSAIASRQHCYKIMQCRANKIPIASSYRIPERLCERPDFSADSRQDLSRMSNHEGQKRCVADHRPAALARLYRFAALRFHVCRPGKDSFLRLYNIVPYRKANQMTYGPHLQFHHYACAICFCGPDADVQFGGNVFVAFTIR